MLDFAEAEFDVVEAGHFAICLGVLARQGEHIGGHIDPDHAARRADLRAGEKDIEAAAAAEVKDHLTGLKGSDSRGVSTRETHIRPFRKSAQLRSVVADAGGKDRHVEALSTATT